MNFMPAKSPLMKMKSELGKGVSLSKCRHCGCMKGALEEMKAVLSSYRDKESSALGRDVSAWMNRMEETLYT